MRRTTTSLDIENLSEEDLEAWEGFASRFSRLTDIFLNRYLRVCALEEDPAFRGTFKDFVNLAEKTGVVTDARRWFAIRELRNKAAHDDDEETLREFFETLLQESNFILIEIKKVLA